MRVTLDARCTLRYVCYLLRYTLRFTLHDLRYVCLLDTALAVGYTQLTLLHCILRVWIGTLVTHVYVVTPRLTHAVTFVAVDWLVHVWVTFCVCALRLPTVTFVLRLIGCSCVTRCLCAFCTLRTILVVLHTPVVTRRSTVTVYLVCCTHSYVC